MISQTNLSCNDIASFINGKIVGAGDTIITGLNRIEYAKQGEITFLANPKYEKYLSSTKASCTIVSESVIEKPKKDMTYIIVKDPYKAFVLILKKIESEKEKQEGAVHPTAIVDESSKIHKSAYIGPYCVIGKNCEIGKNVILHSNDTLYDNVSIKDGTLIHSGVVLREDTIIGKNCIIHSGVVIGDDGFGYIEHDDGTYEKVPQLGNVLIEDNVEIGSNTTIDRAMVGSTVIEKGCIFDNLVQIGHNCVIGENTAMVSQTGIAGSCKVGKRNRFGGQVGLAGHLETADDVVLIAQSGVPKSVPEKGVYFGTPIKERMRAFKIESAISQMPEMTKEFSKIKKLVMDKFNIKSLGD